MKPKGHHFKSQLWLNYCGAGYIIMGIIYKKFWVSYSDLSNFVVGRGLGTDRPGTARGRHKEEGINGIVFTGSAPESRDS